MKVMESLWNALLPGQTEPAPSPSTALVPYAPAGSPALVPAAAPQPAHTPPSPPSDFWCGEPGPSAPRQRVNWVHDNPVCSPGAHRGALQWGGNVGPRWGKKRYEAHQPDGQLRYTVTEYYGDDNGGRHSGSWAGTCASVLENVGVYPTRGAAVQACERHHAAKIARAGR